MKPGRASRPLAQRTRYAQDRKVACRCAMGDRPRAGHPDLKADGLMVFLLVIGAIGLVVFGAALGVVFLMIYFAKGMNW